MLNRPASAPGSAASATAVAAPGAGARPLAASAAGLRLCAICDGIEAVMLFAGYMAGLPQAAYRKDLAMGEALDHLRHQSDLRYDQIVLVPNASGSAVPRLLEALVAEARKHSSDVCILLPTEARLSLPPSVLSAAQILRGPPFLRAGDAAQSDALAKGAAPGVSTEAPALPGAPDLPLAQPLSQPFTQPAAPPRPRSFWRRLLSRKGRDGGKAAARRAAVLPPDLRVVMVMPGCGGVGATTFAVNLAAELAEANSSLSVCLIDLNLQFGNVSGYCKLPANSRVVDAYRGISALDADAFEMCLQPFAPNLQIFPGPAEILPVDGINAVHLRLLLASAREKFDLVIVDLPHHLTDWSEAAFAEASVVLIVAALEVRAAQNAQKLRDLLAHEKLDGDKFLYLLNRMKSRRPALAEEFRAEFERANGQKFWKLLPEGGDEVAMAGNAGEVLRLYAPANPLRRAIRDIAAEMSAQLTRQAAAGLAASEPGQMKAEAG